MCLAQLFDEMSVLRRPSDLVAFAPPRNLENIPAVEPDLSKFTKTQRQIGVARAKRHSGSVPDPVLDMDTAEPGAEQGQFFFRLVAEGGAVADVVIGFQIGVADAFQYGRKI